MVYHISNERKECAGWAVIDDSSDEVVGCHKTKSEANLHLSRLFTEMTYLEQMLKEITESTQEEIDKIIEENNG